MNLEHPPKRLKSRNPIWEVNISEVSVEETWMRRWLNSECRNFTLIINPTLKVP